MINPAIEEDLKRMSLNDVNYADYIKENYIKIPDNATNGDVIKVIFPNVEIFEENPVKTVWGRSESETKWWNSPYKADKEGD